MYLTFDFPFTPPPHGFSNFVFLSTLFLCQRTDAKSKISLNKFVIVFVSPLPLPSPPFQSSHQPALSHPHPPPFQKPCTAIIISVPSSTLLSPSLPVLYSPPLVLLSLAFMAFFFFYTLPLPSTPPPLPFPKTECCHHHQCPQ